MQTITVALDAMGGDFGPHATVPAAVQALSIFPELKIILVGDESVLISHLSSLGFSPNERLHIQHTEKVIADTDKPSSIMRRSVGTSMRQAIDLVEDHTAQACVSGGNTGALMGLSRYRLKLLPGIERPALVSALPTRNGQKVWLLDLGANVSVNANTLFQFAVMGSALAEQHLQRTPRVAILNVGEEEVKGNDLVKDCAEMLQKIQSINYVGFIEAHQLLQDEVDVVVCDGFVGNVCLKASEGVANLFLDRLKHHMLASKFRAWVSKIIFSELFSELKQLNPDQYNGASLLGLRGIVIKSHGSADKTAIINAIIEAVHEVKRQVPSRISDRLETVLLERQN
ncbi:phosphate acyltransferase [Vibrio sp. UCD-FRSSP16_10]|uniref:phosphate acyltransferase PlsX n=1 Tax=unclassified Vibrio TaxID=2614977 RepID=UPI0007FEF588|nr:MULTISPECIES: phosphate acyltransferase PlsX [unclassified Vibrio]OBT08521.1 phosphate acyltransferase [Vibrio sp. UCD-FRSSP16_30]OBT18051.1 phosphate acyltransferase [Vibrio sp. UCD-FRSSP16_10]